MVKSKKVFPSQTTTDADATHDVVWNISDFTKVGGNMRNTGGANALTYTLEGSYDGTNFVEEKAAASIALSSSEKWEVTAPYTHLKILIRATAAGNQTTAVCDAAGSRE